MTIAAALTRPSVYFLFRDDNTEIEITKNKNTFHSHRYKLTEEEKQELKTYFKLNSKKSKL